MRQFLKQGRILSRVSDKHFGHLGSNVFRPVGLGQLCT